MYRAVTEMYRSMFIWELIYHNTRKKKQVAYNLHYTVSA